MQRLRIYRERATPPTPSAGSSAEHGPARMDAALSHALLRAVGAGEAPECLRLYQPTDALAFSVFDRTRPGFRRAVACAQRAGFEPVLRLAGGRAAVFERAALAFAWIVPVRDPRLGIRARFAALSERIAAVLASLGVDARVGEVPGEYCPGEFSVNARGAVKLVGVGQRVARRAAYLGGVVLVSDTTRVRGLLEAVYRELDYPLDPERTGAVGEERPGVTANGVADAWLAALARDRTLEPASFDDALYEEAARLAPRHIAAERVTTATASDSKTVLPR